MRFVALATDYDGTLAHEGRVDAATLSALERCRASGRSLVLVTGRQLEELIAIFPEIDLFERVVAENGALLYTPRSGAQRLLGDAPPEVFLAELRRRDVPMAVGGSIVATVEPHETTVLEVIRDLGLELKVVFNKGAVMVLPPDVNKASGLRAALAELALSPRNAVAIGDGENDHALLELAEYGVAVANAVATLHAAADYASPLDHGEAVVELIDALLADDLAGTPPRAERRAITLGRSDRGEVSLPPHGTRLLIAGAPGSGKTRLARSVLARVVRHGYQFCALDPGGRFVDLDDAVALGSTSRAPGVQEILAALEHPEANLVVRLCAVPAPDRPRFLHALLPGLRALHAQRGRPHWVLVDDAQHSFARDSEIAPESMLDAPSVMLLTTHAGSLAPRALEGMNAVAVLGASPERTLAASEIVAGEVISPRSSLSPDEALVWQRAQPRRFERVHLADATRAASMRRKSGALRD